MTVVPYTRQPAAAAYTADWLLDPAEIAQRIGGTDFVPQGLRNNPAAITAALLYGAEVGLGRMISLSMISVIQGRPTLAAEAQRALILAAGHDIWFDEMTIHRATACGRRHDSEQISRVTWTMDDARRAGLAGKQNWRLYPRAMLMARSSAELARAVFPDVIGGLAATEELDDTIQQPAADNGPGEQNPPARRRRRANVTATSESVPGAPTAGGAEGPAGETAGAAAPDGGAIGDTGQEVGLAAEGAPTPLPPQEQAVLDKIQNTFDAAEPETPAETEPETQAPISDLQRRKMHAMFREKGVIERPAKVAFCSSVIGRKIGSSTELTMDEASRILDHLDQFDLENPQTWPFPEGF